MGRHQGELSKRGVPEEAGSPVGRGAEAGAAKLQEEGIRDRQRVRLFSEAAQQESYSHRGSEVGEGLVLR